MDRRSFVKWITALPLLAQVALQDALGTGWADTRLGVKTMINGRGTWTYTGASLELPQVRAAQEAAAKHFVNIFDLQHAVGRRLAELTGAESGMITSGAAGAIASGTAACIAGSDPERIWQLPDTTGMKSEVVMMGGRSEFDSAIRLTGGKLVLADTLEHLANAINSNTAMIYTTSNMRSSTTEFDTLATQLAVAKRAGVPLFMDAADSCPPVDKLNKFAKMECDLFTVSGGKGLCGPQSSGILLGRKDLIEAAMYNTNPWEGAVCRPMKVGKEEIVGCLAAVEAWYQMDLAVFQKEWGGRVERIAKLLQTVSGVSTSIETPTGSNCFPTLTVTWDEQAWNYTPADCARDLFNGTPSISVVSNDNPSGVLARLKRPRPQRPGHRDRLQIVSMTLQPGEEIIVGRRLRQLLLAAKQKSA
jgi:L-seryl-tRNA(Ser) seleniumtransferase